MRVCRHPSRPASARAAQHTFITPDVLSSRLRTKTRPRPNWGRRPSPVLLDQRDARHTFRRSQGLSIIQPKIVGDHTICSAYSHELPKYGIKVGLTNYAACYATGLLCARRLLKKMGLDEDYEGQTDPDGEMFLVEQEGEKRPFTCVLDVGLVRTSTGNRVFGALKGAVDGGLNIPHSEKRFPGYDREGKEYDAETHKKYIFGGHVQEYMELLEEEDPERYQQQFSKYIEEEIEADGLEDMYKEAFEKIREEPEHEKTEKKDSYDNDFGRTERLTYEERKAKVAAKKNAMRMALEAADDDDDDDDDEDDE